ncbi:uncharacterized protein OCT59_003278 [Rhizophagus irregularis]|uniref:Serine-enriched protein n=2 Tax=Rhizophagus irregularis TaxID=588596 RepID=A0A015M0D7_RHIIW|nr:hypothetical protein GLOIN_2v187151 [Rhizophagus irregularis DAOM 181602=DAOM 197198]EXX60368.1 hypothetical protein RirG_180570 [Rhizophagus irregularis DAOM 197198w]POG69230.1 hypothetical protein GLOIN_2v187151 [Rhizophagus irregularis DAOM 181602=DAOM 197198]UZO11720.1 hypothetical protein OCT59_003278 [Rhizophagus irregularis]GBC37177.1 hypothetical protein GLOIN_2v187151 [Rhizophagus irregularis DAOM 181602=DAOM 197198]|eukprot:XP_025176096.1 hypothetical protein GLOIN_2v187151 [Rhizophagus irregularis DAOM 181602=DAOM 197198]
MTTQFLPKLSQNYIELLEDDVYYDTTIEVGEDPNVKIFRAHRNILCCRSTYLRRTLVPNKKNNDVLAHIKLSNILPEIFQIILKYIYGGILLLNEQDTSNIVKVMVAADELLLQEIVDYLQNYLIKNKSDWIEQHFEFIHRTSFQSNYLLGLQQFCTDLMAKSPEKIFKSLDFTSLPEKSLVQLIKKDYLQMREVKVWEHLLKWGLSQNPTLISDPNNWSDDDFKTMENTLQHYLPLIRFFSLSSKEFLQKVRPYKKLLKKQLYEDLLNSHLNPDSEPSDNISLPRTVKDDEIIDSKIVNLNIISVISRWIDKADNNKFAHLRELYLPYKFPLLLRGSRDGFTPKMFHKLCDGRPATIAFIKVKETEEILGGYNPTTWFTTSDIIYTKMRDCFIFSFKNRDNFKDVGISYVQNTASALQHNKRFGPIFGNDLVICNSKDESKDYDVISCQKIHYEKKIRDCDDTRFSIEDYEIFQIIKR